MDGTGTADGDGSSSPQSMPSLMEPSIRPSLHSLDQELSLKVKSVAAFKRPDQQIQEQRLGGGFLHGFDETVRICLYKQAKKEKIECLAS